METAGVEALAELLKELRAADSSDLTPEEAAAKLWPSFRAAVGHALTSMREEELEGLAGWRAARHATK